MLTKLLTAGITSAGERLEHQLALSLKPRIPRGTAETIVLKALADSQMRFSIAALERATGVSGHHLSALTMRLVNERKIKQTEFARGKTIGYAYAAPTTPDTASVMIVKMVPQMVEIAG